MKKRRKTKKVGERRTEEEESINTYKMRTVSNPMDSELCIFISFRNNILLLLLSNLQYCVFDQSKTNHSIWSEDESHRALQPEMC